MKRYGKQQRIEVGGDPWKVVVLKITGKDLDGSMRTFELLREEEETQVDGGEEFVTAYVPEHMLRRRSGGQA